ncbi:MAG: glycerol-3-phosphate dehydrogenase/oxidase, partial [Actinomycetota bacterium]|nr:glycerol-3-phosphate dehydrogenase/oxidase [Actinomycetota bacterium]
ATRQFDLLVIGGGIVGAGIAAEAARLGLATALVERGDFGAGTSSASSKLIHGGLRYLRLGDVRHVREAHRERSLLMRVVAPHLVRRLPFLLPLYRSGPHGPLTVQAGLVLYSALARARLSRLVPPERARMRVPGVRLDGLRSCALYADAQTNDSRLCLANVRAAAEAGATVLNYAEVRALRIVRGRVAGAEVWADGCAVSVSARAVVNATGPWVDAVRRLEDPSARPSVRLSKGAHVLLQLGQPWSAALTIPHDKVRVSFAVPWQGMLLLGTTDTLYEDEPDAVEATAADVERILAEAAVALEPHVLRPEAIRSTFAGLRVLPGGDGSTASARRETVFLRGRSGMLSVAGGKLTTYRRIALDALAGIRDELNLHQLAGRPVPLPGADDLDQATRRLALRYPELDPQVCSHLAHLYGTLAEEVLAAGEGGPGLLRPLHPEGPDLVAQAVYAVEREWACTAEDILRRRTTVSLRGLAAENVLARVNTLVEERARLARAAL